MSSFMTYLIREKKSKEVVKKTSWNLKAMSLVLNVNDQNFSKVQRIWVKQKGNKNQGESKTECSVNYKTEQKIKLYKE